MVWYWNITLGKAPLFLRHHCSCCIVQWNIDIKAEAIES
jgi:hypothetical protein